MTVIMLLKVLLVGIIGAAVGVEVHFENKDGGFFLKHAGRGSSGSSTDGAPLSVDRFTVFQTARAVSVRASYGPFSTKQTVPARALVPDPLAPAPGGKNASLDALPARLDMSAHVVTREIPRDSPVIRVLFHAGGEAGARVCGVVHATLAGRPPLAGACSPEGGEGACLAQLAVPAAWWGPPPAPGRDSKPLTPPKQPPRLVQLAYSVLEPRAADPEGGGCMPRVQIQPATRLGSVLLAEARAPSREVRADDALVLLVPRAPLYPQARLHLPVFVRHTPERPITLFVMRARVKSGLRLLGAAAASDQWTITVELKAKVATVTAVRKDFPDHHTLPRTEEVLTWSAEAGSGTGRGAARLSCSVRYARNTSPAEPLSASLAAPPASPLAAPLPPRKLTARLDIDKDDIQAVLPISKNWEVLNTAVMTGRQVSQAMKVLIVSQAGQVADVTLQSSCHSEDESVLKVSSSCSSVYVDGSEIRGSSNASVIVKYGTYTGLARFTVWMPELPLELHVEDFRLSQVRGWRVPEDSGGKARGRRAGPSPAPALGPAPEPRSRRRREYGAAVPDDLANSVVPERHSCRLRFQQSPVDVYARFLATDHDSGRVSYLVSRRTWLRVTELVLPLLRVADPRLAALRGRSLRGRAAGRTEVQVLSPITGRVIGAKEIRVGSDKVSISRLIVRVISGLQLNISPDNAIENGYISETTVTRKLTAQYQEGLLDIDIEFSDGSRTPLREVSVDDYVLRVESLDPDVVAFAPMVASHHPRVIAVGEGNGELLRVALLLSEECRVGAAGVVSKGRGGKGVDGPAGAVLAAAAATVQVDFSASDLPQRPDTPQNDDISRTGNKGLLSDLHDILIGIPLKDENNHEPAVQARQLGGSGRATRLRYDPHMTSVEIGMYVLLAIFCFAISIFVVSCVVYASKFKPAGPEATTGLSPGMALQPIADSGKIQVAGLIGTSLGIGRDNRKPPRESTTNAHDWVWLGRATIERHTGHQVHALNRNSQAPPPPPPHADANRNNIPPRDIRITTNPLNLNYADPDDAIKSDNANSNVMATSFDNPNHIELPSQNNLHRARSASNDNRIIDTTTYCKRDKGGKTGRQQINDNARSWQPESNVPPPPPPHAVPLERPSQEYRPPVPPHRTPPLPPSARNTPHKVLADTITPPTRHGRRPPKPSSPQLSASPRKSYNLDNRMLREKYQQSNEAPGNHSNMNDNFNHDMMSNGNDNNAGGLGKVSTLVDNLTNLSREECSGMFEFDVDVQPFGDEVMPHPNKETALLSADIHAEKHNQPKKGSPMEHSPDLMRDSGIGLSDVVYRPKPAGRMAPKSDASNSEFVEIAGETNGASSRGSSPEVKRATIVGNPMFTGSPADKSSDDIPTESLGLDDLEMDYEQIMHYFHNLKESNA